MQAIKSIVIKKRPKVEWIDITHRITPVSQCALEAIVVMTTSFELNHIRFNNFIKKLKETVQTHYDIDLLFVLNNKHNIDILRAHISELRPFFKNVDIIDCNIPDKDDIYTLFTRPDIPKYGLVSGPNIMFLHVMRHCKKYNTVLLLETDCILHKNWLDNCFLYVKYTGPFLISGSTYDGNNITPYTDNAVYNFLHVNGVAFYKTGSQLFQELIQELDTYLVYYAKNIHPCNAYDVVFMHMIISNLKTNINYKYWRYIYRHIIKNTLIINCSIPEDKNKLSLEDIQIQYPSACIIHKKI